ncbi:hypothetical protein IU486_21805 [Streptomyces gardneri]|uniref:hypothetical protein n=1 Tax=Nocardia TaxID=1817 RepID=UPI0013583272|nr:MULTISPECIES: hypothetical protein [Nocardia]MBF6167369.1 hypothetical protein [Streptomyces gardneri]
MTTPEHNDELRRQGEPARTASRWWRVSVAVITLLVSLCCVATLWLLMSDAAFPYLVLAGWALVLLGALWLVIGLFGAIRYRRYLRLLLAPGAVALTCALAWADLPEDFGWRVSAGSLERLATSCDASAHGRYGVYTITSVVERDDGCLLYTDGGLIDPVGFAYFPHGAPRQGPPRSDGDVGYTPLEGSWYRFVQRF